MIVLDLYTIFIFISLGSVVGFMAGLLGVGGGTVMVPVLTMIFAEYIDEDGWLVHLALGTSMAAIVMTSLSSMISHNRHGAVIWKIVFNMTPGILIGAFWATLFVVSVSSFFLAVFFAVFILIIALQMMINIKPKSHSTSLGYMKSFVSGNIIGAISSMVSIGGGVMTVPYLVWNNINVKKAIGTSSAIGFPIAVSGTLGYIVNGWHYTSIQNQTIGFVYWPGVLLISLSSFFTAPIGAKWAHRLPVPILKKIFAVLLVFLSIKMMFSVIH